VRDENQENNIRETMREIKLYLKDNNNNDDLNCHLIEEKTRAAD